MSVARALPIRFTAIGAFALISAIGFSSAARADCQEDLGVMMKKRNSQMESLNRLSKGGKGKLDPIAACPALRNLASVEGQIVAYAEKNKEWCNLPPDFLDNAKKGRAGSQKFAGQACAAAVQVKKMKEQAQQQAAGGGGPQVQRLPTGPL